MLRAGSSHQLDNSTRVCTTIASILPKTSHSTRSGSSLRDRPGPPSDPHDLNRGRSGNGCDATSRSPRSRPTRALGRSGGTTPDARPSPHAPASGRDRATPPGADGHRRPTPARTRAGRPGVARHRPAPPNPRPRSSRSTIRTPDRAADRPWSRSPPQVATATPRTPPALPGPRTKRARDRPDRPAAGCGVAPV
jgi:hypothetical protein